MTEEEIHKQTELHEKTDRRISRIRYLIILTVIALLVMIFVSAAAWNRVGVQNEQLLKIAASNEKELTLLIDCTDPKGQCYQEGQRRTGEAVGNINEVIIAAVYCADTMPNTATLEELEGCVKRILAVE